MVIVSTLGIAPRLTGLFRRLGICVISQACVQGEERERLLSADMVLWAEAQMVMRAALLAWRKELDGVEPSLCQSFPISARDARDCLVQVVNARTAFAWNFAHILARRTAGARIIVDVPPGLARRLSEAGAPIHLGLSQWAWRWSKTALGLRALAHHVKSALKLVRRRLKPELAPANLRGSNWILVWGAYFPARQIGLGQQHMLDALAQRTLPGLDQDCALITQPSAAGETVPGILTSAEITGLRCEAPIDVSEVLRGLFAHLRAGTALLRGRDVDVLLGRDWSELPTAIGFFRAFRPRRVLTGIYSAMHVPLWMTLVRAVGGTLDCAWNSTQAQHVQKRAWYTPGLVPEIYYLDVFDRHHVWNDFHKAALEAVGFDPVKIHPWGRPIQHAAFFAREPIRTARVLTVDYFDQAPLVESKMIAIGAPRAFQAVEEQIASVEATVQALDTAIGPGKWRLRIKLKRNNPKRAEVPLSYFRFFEDLTSRRSEVDMLDFRLSAAKLHQDSDITVGVPFVSPVISADALGIPACFLDVFGDTVIEPEQAHGIPVVVGAAGLAQWLAATLRTLTNQIMDAK